MELVWRWTEEGIEFVLQGPAGPEAVDGWGRHHRSLEPPHRRAVTLLLRCQDDPDYGDRLRHTGTPGVLVPHTVVAREDFPSTELLLPPPAPVTITVEASAAVTSPSCRVTWRLVHWNGRVITAPKIRGCLIEIGRHTFLLKDPLYSLIHGIEEFNTIDGHRLDERMLKWGELVRFIPEGARVSQYLSTMRVTRAAAFRLEPRHDEEGQITFDPVLVAVRPKEPAADADAVPQPVDRGPVDLLPPADQASFAKVFRKYPEAQQRYVIGRNTYVVLEPLLAEALKVVRRMQAASVQERLAFLQRPHTYLRQALEEVADEEHGDDLWIDRVLDQIFDSTGYSERVQGIGVWQPKILPWLAGRPTQWLPDEPGYAAKSPGDEGAPAPAPLGLIIDGQPVAIDPVDCEGLIQQIQEARDQGQPAVEYKGVAIPATVQAEEALQTLIRQRDTGLEAEAGSAGLSGDGAADGHGEAGAIAEGNHAEKPLPLVLLIHDNLEDLTFSIRGKRRPAREIDVQLFLRSQLKPHQLEGIQWLQAHWREGSPGALLADDMGLGKTLQALAFLKWVQLQLEAAGDTDEGPVRRPLLIVAPTGLLQNWVAEHEQHFHRPGLGVPVRAYGRELKRLRTADAGYSFAKRGQAHPVGSIDVNTLQRADWVLTTYETLRDYQMDFGQVHWAVIVFDEAQRIKEPAALVTHAAKAMKADFVLTVTGTPVENRMADFWCIVDTAQPGLLKDLRTFVKTYEPGDDAADLAERLKTLRRQVDQAEPEPPTHPKVMLRRIKHDHLKGLPSRTTVQCPEPMPSIQAERYAAAVEAGRRAGGERGKMLTILQELRRISLHPRTDDVDELSPEQIIQESARFRALFRILDEIHDKREKALVFLDDLMWIQRLRLMIQDRYGLARTPLAITGDVSGDKRKAFVDSFQEAEGFQVLLMTPKAGGVGLTATAANHVIHLSRWWNPAVEDQATDRVYRIGQTRPVFVYYPMAIHPRWPGHSFDERLHEHLERKRALSRQLLLPGHLTENEVDRLFQETVGAPGTGGASRAAGA